MKFTGFSGYKTGVLIPVFSLRSQLSCGCGEFSDLIPLADWCTQSGLDIIQLLPVNDTGDDASPYNALSAFALHPLYCRLTEIPELAALPAQSQKMINAEIELLKKTHEVKSRVAYKDVVSGKLMILTAIFEESQKTIEGNKDFQTWISANPWVKEYGVFRSLKELHNQDGWQNWKAEYRHGSTDVVLRVWKDDALGSRALFFAWVQYRLELQFQAVAEYLLAHGIMLKGDIPIMMNEDSADVWAHGSNFILEQRAGAPPDMFSRMGQNWGFPIYNWQYLEAHNYEWWRQRLRHADKFYQAYRIDHVLGFFRIWTIDRYQREGLLGYFKPSIYISRNDLHAMGFDDGRIRWISEPHIPGWRIRELFGMRSIEIIGRCFNRLGTEDLYLFKPEIRGEKGIAELPLIDGEREILFDLYRDRALIHVDDGLYAPAWTFRECSRYKTLSEQEKNNFEDIVARRGRESEELWQKHGEKLLRFMQETVPMLTCAEDLGVVPDCVPVTLQDLGILGLKIPRWAREWKIPGQPYIAPADYPFLSVCAPSVHDTSTLRGWWERENEQAGFWSALGFQTECPQTYNSDVAKKIIGALLNTHSALLLFQIQDLFALIDTYRVEDPTTERVNIPGTVQDSNWSYRIPMTVEELNLNVEFSKILSGMVETRKKKALPKAK